MTTVYLNRLSSFFGRHRKMALMFVVEGLVWVGFEPTRALPQHEPFVQLSTLLFRRCLEIRTSRCSRPKAASCWSDLSTRKPVTSSRWPWRRSTTGRRRCKLLPEFRYDQSLFVIFPRVAFAFSIVSQVSWLQRVIVQYQVKKNAHCWCSMVKWPHS